MTDETVKDNASKGNINNQNLRNHPLNGIGLEALLGDLVRQYGWEVLAEQLPIDCFKSYPSFKSSMKFLQKTEWARERLEELYLYKFLQYPLPSPEQCEIEPRNRVPESARQSNEPFNIQLGDAEFFACPGKCPTTTKPSHPSRRQSQSSDQPHRQSRSKHNESKNKRPKTSEHSSDPWAKWRKDWFRLKSTFFWLTNIVQLHQPMHSARVYLAIQAQPPN